MKFRTKIWMLPACAAVVSLAGVLASFWVSARTSADLRHLGAVDTPYVEHMLRVERQVEQFRLSLQSAASEGDAAKLSEVEAVVTATHQALASLAQLDGKAAVAEALRGAYDAYQGAALGATRAMLSQQDPGDRIQRMQQAQATLTRQLGDRMAEARQLAAARQDAAVAGVRQGVWTGLATGVLVLVALGVASWRIVASVWRELGDEPAALRELVQRVARGDLRMAAGLGTPAGDSLHAAVGQMVQRLADTVGTIRLASDSIAQATQEIASGNQDLSGRTEHTASNLQQAAASMEQLVGTVRQSAEAARTADTLAATATQAAERGGERVGRVVHNMREINEASRKIIDIIAVIDSLAFQTNILALNAAVEAARAGEQGRGFAVVAGEVRTLAQRSATAAREIKSLITASTDKVDVGTQLVEDAGSAMQEIVAGVCRVNQIINEISRAAAAQSTGLGEVNHSVGRLDEMTQQNAALVEQSAAAAESLREQAHRLAASVAVFHLDAAAPVA